MREMDVTDGEPAWVQSARNAILDNRKIVAIKLVWSHTDLALKEIKNLVETGGLDDPERIARLPFKHDDEVPIEHDLDMPRKDTGCFPTSALGHAPDEPRRIDMVRPGHAVVSSDLAPKIWVGEDELPPSAARWLDPDVPIPDDVELIPSVADGADSWMLFGIALVPIVFALLLLPDLPASWTDERAAERYGNTGLFLSLVGIAIALVRGGRRAARRAADAKAGRRRYGLFLGPDALLFRGTTPDPCVLLPRAAVTAARTLIKRVSGTAGYQVLVVDYRGADGEPAPAPELFGPYTPSGDEMVERINRWAT